jgi:outer membrane protein OmpA-like peptidoglycan-associated protein
MLVKTFAGASLFIISASICASAGDTAYKAEDIVRFFTAAKPQATRGICVGTAEECGGVQPEQKPLSFNLMVNFDLDSATLTDEAKANLDEFSKALKDPRLSSTAFAVDGYTDASGAERYNLKLSDRRAQSVVGYLSERGIERSRLIPKGFGKANPIAPDPYDPVNRRVETSLVVR